MRAASLVCSGECFAGMTLFQSVFLSELGAFFVRKPLEISLPAGAELDVKPPEAPDERFRVLVVLRTDFAVGTGHSVILFFQK